MLVIDPMPLCSILVLSGSALKSRGLKACKLHFQDPIAAGTSEALPMLPLPMGGTDGRLEGRRKEEAKFFLLLVVFKQL